MAIQLPVQRQVLRAQAAWLSEQELPVSLATDLSAIEVKRLHPLDALFDRVGEASRAAIVGAEWITIPWDQHHASWRLIETLDEALGEAQLFDIEEQKVGRIEEVSFTEQIQFEGFILGLK